MQTPPTHSYLKQRHLLFGTREFIIKGSDSLLIRERSLLSQHETLIPLETLQANPTQSSSFAVKWLLLSLFTGSITAMLMYYANHYQLAAIYIPAAVLAGTTLVLLFRFFLYTTRLTIFRHITSNENYLYFWRDKPNPRQFRQFIDALRQLIQQAHQPKAP